MPHFDHFPPSGESYPYMMNTLNYFNLQLKTLVEGSIIVYASSQVVSRVLCRDHDQQEAGGQEEHLGSAQGLPDQILAIFVDCIPSKIILRLLPGGGLATKWLVQTSGQVLVACGGKVLMWNSTKD